MIYSYDSDDADDGLPCKDKITFDSLRQAMTAANVADYQHSVKVSPYRCQYCQLWHLSSV